MTWLIKNWYNNHPLRFLLLPFASVYRLLIYFRMKLYHWGIYKKTRFSVPIIVVGNLTVGGTGKTPLVIWLADYLKQQGYKPGIVSRGYGGRAPSYPQKVLPNSHPTLVGDEAVLLARATQCPMQVAPKRIAAVKALLNDSDCTIIISDDGLQHYAMERDIEIVVLDGQRRLGNELILPAGPLREPKQRLEKVDFVVANGIAKTNEFTMQLKPKAIVNLVDDQKTLDLKDVADKKLYAVAAIGHPQRFYDTLIKLGLKPITRSFPDHYLFSENDFAFAEDGIVIMTEKDAVKCQSFAKANFWYLPVTAELDAAFGPALLKKLAKISAKNLGNSDRLS